MDSTGESKPRAEQESEGMLTSFQPLSYTAIQREVETLQAVSAASMEEWQREISMYEEMIQETNPKILHFNVVPRRNYPNKGKEVKDPELFPYHTACYSLIEAYEQNETESIIPGHLPCTPHSVNETIHGLSLEWAQAGSNIGSFLQCEWDHGLENLMSANEDPEFWLRYDAEDVDFATRHHYGLACFPPEPEARANILFKLLRHALSDLQKDHYLAGAVIARMSSWKLLQDVDCLRKVMSIVESGLRECDGNCLDRYLTGQQEAPDHSCEDVRWSCLHLYQC